MLRPVENGIEISQDEPGNIEGSEFRKLLPKKALLTKKKRVINKRNDEVFVRNRRDNNMKNVFGHNNRGDQPNIFVPKNDDTARETIR